MQKTFRNAITVLKLDFLEMKCLPQMRLPRVQSQKQTGALSPGGTQPRTVPSPLTHRQGRACQQLTDCGCGAFISISSVSGSNQLQKSVQRMKWIPSILSFNFQTDIYQHNRFTSAARSSEKPGKVPRCFTKLLGQRCPPCQQLLAREVPSCRQNTEGGD